MKALVVYDTQWGNTEKVAQAIARGLGAKAVRVGEAAAGSLAGIELLVLGSPVRGGRATDAMQRFINGMAAETARRLAVAAFDTRMRGSFPKIFGFAAVRMDKAMAGKGSARKRPPEGFLVAGREGPLAEGELGRAERWGAEMAQG